MTTEKTDRLLNKIGRVLAQDADYPLEGTLLYARVEHMAVEAAIFEPAADHVIYHEPMNDLTWPLLWLWGAEPIGKRWAEIEYLIRDGRFTATYTYPDEIDPDEEPLDRRRRIVARYFGDKPIVYPPKDAFFARQTFAL